MNLRGCLSSGLVVRLLCSRLTREAAAAEGRQLRGALYAIDSRQKVKLYTWEMMVCPELWTSRYRRLDGSLVVEDFTRFSGQRFMEHGYVRQTIADGVFVTGPAVFPFIQQHLAGLLRGEQLEVEYGVLDRLDSLTFVLSSPSTSTDREVTVRLRAASLSFAWPLIRLKSGSLAPVSSKVFAAERSSWS
jgi:hypothetical protein